MNVSFLFSSSLVVENALGDELADNHWDRRCGNVSDVRHDNSDELLRCQIIRQIQDISDSPINVEGQPFLAIAGVPR